MENDIKSLYNDDSIEILRDAILIKRYYFPFGFPRVIKWNEIKKVSVEKVRWFNGKLRVWGLDIKPYWFNFDIRFNKNKMIVIDTGGFIKAAITPDDIDAVYKIIKAKLRS